MGIKNIVALKPLPQPPLYMSRFRNTGMGKRGSLVTQPPWGSTQRWEDSPVRGRCVLPALVGGCNMKLKLDLAQHLWVYKTSARLPARNTHSPAISTTSHRMSSLLYANTHGKAFPHERKIRSLKDGDTQNDTWKITAQLTQASHLCFSRKQCAVVRMLA